MMQMCILILAAAADLGNVFETVNAFTPKYKQEVEITINYHDSDVVVRNALTLLLIYKLRKYHDVRRIIPHLLYSSFISSLWWKNLTIDLRGEVQNFYNSIKQKKPDTQAFNTWDFQPGVIRLTLSRRSWRRMLDLLQPEVKLSFIEAVAAREAAMFDRKSSAAAGLELYKIPTDLRASYMRFQQTGILHPFGWQVHEHDVPNP
jgi:hypothetical protein